MLMTKKLKPIFMTFLKLYGRLDTGGFLVLFSFFFFFNKCVFINVQNTGIAAQMKGEFTIN